MRLGVWRARRVLGVSRIARLTYFRDKGRDGREGEVRA